jgi:AcrR family transcriptional regulator
MTTARRTGLEPRKRPRQARSTATVEAVLEATIQVLVAEGAPRLTTTRVAERAGVSVGTMYQYFPHKQSLLYAVLERHLDGVASAVERACRQLQASSIATMASGVVNAYLDAKTVDVEASRALYMVSGEIDISDLLGRISKRIAAAIEEMLATATDAEFDDLSTVTFTLGVAMSGAVRVVFDRGAKKPMLRALREELPTMCAAYLIAVSNNVLSRK